MTIQSPFRSISSSFSPLSPFLTYDSDALTYITAVQLADEQPLETAVKVAINDFVVGCKNDGIWDAIKACCILAGARTLSGALIPLVGTAPTNYNFVAGDYNRETGLVGDGSTKYLDSNRNNNADGQDNHHLSHYSPDYNSSAPIISSNDPGGTNGMSLLTNGNSRSRTSTNFLFTATDPFIGMSRASAAAFNIRYDGSTVSSSVASAAPTSSPILVYRLKNFFGTDVYSAARLSFYSIGESLDLALLDTRVSNLMTAIGAAIP
jgi:hypothetical protein